MTPTRQALIAAAGIAMQAYQRSTDAWDDQVARGLQLNRTDLRCLDWLFDGPRTAGQLAEAIGLSSAATTTLLDRLERRSLVQRVRGTSDRRQVLVEMTELGRRETGDFYAPLAIEGAALLERYTDDQIALLVDFVVRARKLTDSHRDRLRQAQT
jgi:DNA-binding MarR family transcriptional regulator